MPANETTPDTPTAPALPPTILERMARCPKKFIYLVIGLVQGILLAVLIDDSVIRHHALFYPLFIPTLLLPLVFYCSQSADWRRRRWILFLALGALLAIGVYQGMTAGELVTESRFSGQCFQSSLILSLAILAGIPAVSVSAKTEEARYRQWVAAALQTLGTLAEAGLILGLCWLVIASSVWLFELLGVRLEKLVFHANFFIIISTVIFAFAFSRARRDDSVMNTVFTRGLQLCGWIYPVIAVIGILFVASWAVGIEPLLETHKAATILLWFIALLIFFFNLHSRCGTEIRNEKWLRVLTALCWLAAIPMLIVALYGLGLRIEQRGLTPDRIWGMFTAGIIAIFVLGYAAHSLFGLRQWQRGKQLVSRTHLVATLALTVGIILTLSGIVDPRRISVQSQLQQLEKAEILDENGKMTYSAENLIDFFGREGGIYGEAALRELAARTGSEADKRVAQYTKNTLEGKNRHEFSSASIADALRSLKVFPGAEAPPPGLIEALAEHPYWLPGDCHAPQDAALDCILWKVRFEENGVENYIPLARDNSDNRGKIWQKTGGGWQEIEFLYTPMLNELFIAVLENSVQLVPPENPRYDILIGGTRIIPPSELFRHHPASNPPPIEASPTCPSPDP
jgi:hypothetical protein